jgi:DNA-binding NarL/FixJ family response regulator
VGTRGQELADHRAILGLSSSTIDEQVAEACRKLGVRTRVQAAVTASGLGLLDG